MNEQDVLALLKQLLLSAIERRRVHGEDTTAALLNLIDKRLELQGNTTPEQFEARMREIFPEAGYDEEGAHSRADALMCDLLTQLGFGDGVEIFNAATKWYA